MNDLNLNGINFEPLGRNLTNYFEGEFDGQNHTISNMFINLPNEFDIGFISINNGMIKNLNFDNTCEINGLSNIGTICGSNYGEINNCKSIAIINGKNETGGICGYCIDGIMKNCNFYGMVNGETDVGGICGWMQDETHENLISRCIIKGKINIGGICGILFKEEKIYLNKFENYSKINEIKNINQIVGFNKDDIEIKNCIEKDVI